MLDFPSSPAPGATYSSAGLTWVWDGVKWTPGDTGNAFLPMSGGTLTGPLILAADPAAALGAATKEYTDAGDAKKLALTGGVLTGLLTLAQDPAGALDAATKEYVDNSGATFASWASGFVNKFRNAGLEYWQHGQGMASGYCADGWICAFGGTAGNAKPFQFGSGSRGRAFNCIQLNGAAGTTDAALYQRIESYISAHLYTATDASPITVSALVYNGGPVAVTPSLSLNFPASGAQDNWASGGTAFVTVNLQSCPAGQWTLVAYTFAAPPVNIQTGLSIYFDFLGMVNAASAYLCFGWPDVRLTPNLPVGLCANPPLPEIRLVGIEHVLNMRYFQVGSGYSGGTFFGGSVTSGSNYWATRPFVIPLRATPTVVWTNAGSASFPATNSTNQISAQGVQEMRTANATAASGWFSSNFTVSAEL